MKRIYFQPSVTVAQVALNNVMLTVSPGGDNTPVYYTPTNDQW